VKIEIDVEIPAGWAFKRYGIPLPRDYYLDPAHWRDPRVRQAGLTIDKYIIVEQKIVVWPGWLKPGWVCRDKTGTWWSLKKPTWGLPGQDQLDADGWHCAGGEMYPYPRESTPDWLGGVGTFSECLWRVV
jgi:hypothetical protein